jgi:RNA polymerase sigma-70 factor (ECF subfamily)
MRDTKREIELMLAVKTGDRKALEEIYRLYGADLMRFFFRLCWDRSLSEDCVQEVFLRLWASARNYEPSAELSSYVYRVAKNLWLNEARRLRMRPVTFTVLSGRGGEGEAHGAGAADTACEKKSDIPGGVSPAASAVDDETRREVARAIDRLPEKLKLVLLLARYHEMNYAQISEALEIPVGTVKSRMAHAMDLLRKWLADRVG